MNRPRLFGLIGILAAGAAVILALFQPAAFFHAYLFAVLAWLNPALGCLLLVFIHRMTGGKWGRILQPYLAAGAATLPWALLFAVPLFFGLNDLFPWDRSNPSSLLAMHPTYLSPAGYIIRGVLYFLLYLWLIHLTRRPDQAWTGPVGFIVFVLTTYLLSVDWVVALEPGWYSTGFPVVLMASQAVSAMALSIAAAVWLKGSERAEEGTRHTWIDLGNLMLAALMFWAYVSYGEFLIIWSSNLPKQSGWYVHRNAGGWHWILIALVLLNLVTPVLCLLSPRMKSRSRAFAFLTSGVVFFQIIYLYWLILPAFRTTGIGFQAIDALLPVALGGLYLFFYLGNVRREVTIHA